MSPSSTPHQRAAALLRRQQSTTARVRAGLPQLLDQLEQLDEPSIADVEGFQLRASDRSIESPREPRADPDPAGDPGPGGGPDDQDR
jgi:hypothetical protein